jgi:sulfite exporter TauE/SafE
MHLPEINSSTTALLAGLVTSLHCAGMCGPLACIILPSGKERSDVSTVSTVYHLGRLVSYSVLGALAGGLGHFTVGFLENGIVRWLPWLMVLFFIGLAFQWERYLPKLLALSQWTLRLHGWFRKRSPVQAAAVLGLSTPLLPCGPLYFAVAASLLAGSALKGLEFMLTFALGTIPLLWLAQSQFHWVRSKLSPLWMARMRISLALVSAVAIAWRLRGTLGFEGPSLENFICCF